jgi:hypothetical protein
MRRPRNDATVRSSWAAAVVVPLTGTMIARADGGQGVRPAMRTKAHAASNKVSGQARNTPVRWPDAIG